MTTLNLQGHWEFYKSMHEFLRHLSTLSTGAILILSAFMKHVFATPIWKSALAISVFCFLITVVASVASYLFILKFLPRESPKRNLVKWEINVFAYSFMIALVSFALGMVSLALFLIRNILA